MCTASISHLWVSLWYVSLRLTAKLHTKYQVSGTLKKHSKWDTIARIYHHCLWSDSKPSFDTYSRWEKGFAAPISHLWITLCYFPPRSAPKLCTAKCEIWVQSQHNKWNDVLLGEISIAFEMIRNLSLMCIWRWRALLTASAICL